MCSLGFGVKSWENKAWGSGGNMEVNPPQKLCTKYHISGITRCWWSLREKEWRWRSEELSFGSAGLYLGFGGTSGTWSSPNLGVPKWNLVLVVMVPGSQCCSPTSPSPAGFSCFRNCWSGKFRSLERGGGAAALIWIIPKCDSSVVPAQEMGICCSGILVWFVWQRWQPGPFPVSKTTGVTPLRRTLGLLLLNQQPKYNSQIF